MKKTNDDLLLEIKQHQDQEKKRLRAQHEALCAYLAKIKEQAKASVL